MQCYERGLVGIIAPIASAKIHLSGEDLVNVAGPRVWNQLPTDLKTIMDTRVFRHKLKSFLFSLAYP